MEPLHEFVLRSSHGRSFAKSAALSSVSVCGGVHVRAQRGPFKGRPAVCLTVTGGGGQQSDPPSWVYGVSSFAVEDMSELRSSLMKTLSRILAEK